MKKFILVIIILCATAFTALHAEYIYLTDGQVIQGTVVSEDKDYYTVETKYQTRRIARDEVIRIMYGERKMEPLFLIMNDGTVRRGFLVDQDADKIIMREKEDSPNEITILKKDIRQMSASEIIPLNPSVYLRAGYFYPFNSGGSELDGAPAYFAGSDFNFQFINNVRILVEAGFINCESSNPGLFMRIIPLQVSPKYYYSIGSTQFSLIPGISAGISLIDYDDGENSQYRGFVGTAGCSMGVGYEIIRNTLYTAVSMDYMFFHDGEEMLHSLMASFALSYRFK